MMIRMYGTEDEEKDICADQQVTEPEISDEDRKMYEAYMAKAIKLAQKAYVQGMFRLAV